MVLDSPGLLLFDTNWWEDSYHRLVALKIQDEAPISAAFAFQKGSEFLHLFNHFLKKLLEGGIIYKVTINAGLALLHVESWIDSQKFGLEYFWKSANSRFLVAKKCGYICRLHSRKEPA